MNNWKQCLVKDDHTIRDAMIRLTELALLNADLFVVDDNERLLGSLSDGDIRRALIKGAEMTDSVVQAMNSNCIYHTGSWPNRTVLNDCKKKNIRFLPLLNADRRVTKIIDTDIVTDVVPVDAILMAGGEGLRLRPLTEKLPKPLLPIGNKAIIEHNVDRLIKYGVLNIRISINYLGDLIQEYFDVKHPKEINIEYIREDKPLGTIGAVSGINNWKSDCILIMNSDLLTDIDFADFYNDFIASGADLAIASIPYSVNIPYAVLEMSEGGGVKALAEKPSYTFYSNAGIYLLKKELLGFIPGDCCYNMTDLIELLIEKGYKIASFPIHGYWLDIGKMNDYVKAQDDIKHIKL